MGRLETDRIREQTTGDDSRPNPQAMGFPPHRTGATAACGFMILYAAAHHLTGDYGLFGLSNDAVRSAAHFYGYGALALLLSKALFNQYLLVWIISVLTATVEEIHQIVVPCRCACLEDWGLNVAGIILFPPSRVCRRTYHCRMPNAECRML